MGALIEAIAVLTPAIGEYTGLLTTEALLYNKPRKRADLQRSVPPVNSPGMVAPLGASRAVSTLLGLCKDGPWRKSQGPSLILRISFGVIWWIF